jgi:hypothetical protein
MKGVSTNQGVMVETLWDNEQSRTSALRWEGCKKKKKGDELDPVLDAVVVESPVETEYTVLRRRVEREGWEGGV